MASPDARRLSVAAGWTVVRVTGPAAPACLRPWCRRVRSLLAGGRVVVCDLRQLASADLAAVDAVARLCLAARRAGTDLRILAGTDLEQLWEWTGLGALRTGNPCREGTEDEHCGCGGAGRAARAPCRDGNPATTAPAGDTGRTGG